jgi:hypothetical protein
MREERGLIARFTSEVRLAYTQGQEASIRFTRSTAMWRDTVHKCPRDKLSFRKACAIPLRHARPGSRLTATADHEPLDRGHVSPANARVHCPAGYSNISGIPNRRPTCPVEPTTPMRISQPPCPRTRLVAPPTRRPDLVDRDSTATVADQPFQAGLPRCPSLLNQRTG